jgi:hypothetical protein
MPVDPTIAPLRCFFLSAPANDALLELLREFSKRVDAE